MMSHRAAPPPRRRCRVGRIVKIRGVPFHELGDGWYAKPVSVGGAERFRLYWGLGSPYVTAFEEGGGFVTLKSLEECAAWVAGRVKWPSEKMS